jgi:integrase
MGTVFLRGDSSKWWIGFTDAAGKRHNVSTGQTDEVYARELLANLERKVKAQREAMAGKPGLLLVETFAKKWLADRRANGVADADHDQARLAHVLPRIGKMELAQVRRQDIVGVVRGLTSKAELAPRTIRHIYGTLRVMFADAVLDEVISESPCTLRERRGELPPKKDADPLWRANAVFSREEVERIVSDEDLPEDRRVLYAMVFLLGARIGEVAALRWTHYDAKAEPLGRMIIAQSFSQTTKAVKGTKTDVVRQMPVHPVLAAELARWKVGGWQRMLGRAPASDDLIIPSRRNQHRRANHVLRRFHQDLERMGLRPRRVHDGRRTFISLAQADGAQPHILKWATHGPPKDIISAYTTLPWASLCDEVKKVRIDVNQGRLIAFPLAATGSYGAATVSGQEKTPEVARTSGASLRGVGDLNP